VNDSPYPGTRPGPVGRPSVRGRPVGAGGGAGSEVRLAGKGAEFLLGTFLAAVCVGRDVQVVIEAEAGPTALGGQPPTVD
jgi:hypothetical protein